MVSNFNCIPQIGVVITADQSQVAQAKPGDTVRFEAVSLDEAHVLYKRFKETIGLGNLIGREMQSAY